MNATNRHRQPDENPPDGVQQVRVVVELDDVDAAIVSYRDQLGMPEAPHPHPHHARSRHHHSDDRCRRRTGRRADRTTGEIT
jgi:hypothetical protein